MWATALGALGLLAAVPQARSQSRSPVLEMLHTARDVRTRIAAANTAGRMRPPGAREALEQALSDPSASVRIAAVVALGQLGDGGALVALGRHAGDGNARVRSAIARAMQSLSARAPSPVGPGAPGAVPMPQLAAAAPGRPALTDWSHARYGLLLGALSNRAGGRTALVDILRDAIVSEASRTGEIAVATAALPPEAQQRAQGGRLRVYGLEGSVHSLRRWVVATTLSVRAEVSLVLLAQPARSMLGSLTGAATAQDPNRTDDDAAERLEQRALEGAVHGAMAGLRASLEQSPRR